MENLVIARRLRKKVEKCLSCGMKVILLTSVLCSQIFVSEIISHEKGRGSLRIARADISNPWYNTKYLYRKEIIVDHTKAGNSNLSNFPVFVFLEDNDLKTKINGGKVENTNGYDIIFTLPSGTKLDHEVESYDGENGVLVAWVKLPSLSNTADTSFYMYYGNQEISVSQENRQAVWNDGGTNNFRMIQHMNEDPAGAAPQFLDSTQYGTNGVTYESMDSSQLVAGLLGGALQLDGTNDYISFPQGLLSGKTNVTLSVWFKTTDSRGSLFSQYNLSGAYGHLLNINDGLLKGGFYASTPLNNSASFDVAYGTSVNDDMWHQAVMTYNGENVILYVDGLQRDGKAETGGVWEGTTYGNYIGAQGYGHIVTQGDGYFGGIIDEARISLTDRSADWIAAEYANQSSPSTFYSVGGEELASSAVIGNTIPQRVVHFNTNTYANLNTITSTGDVTFHIQYDAAGDIKWYKDGVLIQTDGSSMSSDFTASWTSASYGTVREVKAVSINPSGSSAETIWKVEVREMGTATITEGTSIELDGGWTDFPSLYMTLKKQDNSAIDYLREKSYVLKKPIKVNSSVLQITSETVDELRMGGSMQVFAAGTIIINGVDNIVGWDAAAGKALVSSTSSLSTSGNARMDIINSSLRRIGISYHSNERYGNIIDNNNIYEGGIGYENAKGLTISNNNCIGSSISASEHSDVRDVFIKNNKISRIPGESGNPVHTGNSTHLIGNQISYSSWNLVEFKGKVFSKYNDLFENGGVHNGLNGWRDYSYSVNDYCHNLENYNCFYIQVTQPNVGDPSTWFRSRQAYIFNSYTKNGSGIGIHGVDYAYIYNHTSDASSVGITMGVEEVVFRKSNFLSTKSGISAAIGISDYGTGDYGFTKSLLVVDSQFSENPAGDFLITAAEGEYGNPIISSVNTFRKKDDGSLIIPGSGFYNNSGNGEYRHYAYLDALVQDSTGAPIEDAIISITPYAAPPVFSVAAGTYSSAQGVTISSTGTPGATIYYTTDGTDPATSSTRAAYSSSLNISSTTTLKAIAAKSGFVDSPVTSVLYTITGSNLAAAPVFSLAPEMYSSTQSISISSATPGATIYYTTDRSTPTTSSQVYSSPISVAMSRTIKAIAAAPGLSTSGVTTGVYYINLAPYEDIPVTNVMLPPPPSDLQEYPAENLPMSSLEKFEGARTNVMGHTMLPNYGWSADITPSIALMFRRSKSRGVNFENYQYLVTATYGGQSVSHTVTPGTSWYREDPTIASKTIVFTLDQEEEKYALNVNSGSGSGIYPAGETVSLSANPAPSGKVFSKWIGDTAGIANVNSANTSIVVQSSDASISAYYADVLYTLTVVGGEGSGNYPAGKMISIEAPKYVDSINEFERWTGSGAPHTLYPKDYSSSFIMPAGNITVEANYRDISQEYYQLSIQDQANSQIYLKKGETAIVTANPPAGGKFSFWFGYSSRYLSSNTATTTVTMPGQDMVLIPIFVGDAAYHGLTVTGGTGTGSYTAGESIQIVANEAPSGKAFAGWTGNTGCLNDPSSATATVTMPSSAVNLTATYSFMGDPAPYALTVEGGTGTGTYLEGVSVNISAGAAPAEKKFFRWIGDTKYLSGMYVSEATVTMPGFPITLTAVYEDELPSSNISLTVNSGLGSGSYSKGQVVEISANAAPAGQTFDKWTGNVLNLSNVYSPSATITMQSSPLAVSATYKPLYSLTVTNGNSSGSYSKGQEVSISADAPPSGQSFSRWTGDTQYLADPTSPLLTLVMPEGLISLTATYSNPLSSPVFSPAQGSYSSAQQVSITSPVSGAIIYYTTDGSSPNLLSNIYSSPLTISTTTTLKAMATKEGYANSPVATSVYTINIPAPPSGGGGSGGSGGGGGISPSAPIIDKLEITKKEGNDITLSLSVRNASQMMLSASSSFTGASWTTFDSPYVYAKKDGQTDVYFKFRSSTGYVSQMYSLSLSQTPGSSSPYPQGTLLKTDSSFRVYVMIEGKKKWIPTPEVFSQLGYKWTEIKILSQEELTSIPDYEDNLIRALGNYKVYLVVQGVKRHIPNPEVFLNYGFLWEDVVDVPQETVDKYQNTYLVKENGKEEIHYLRNDGVRKLIPSHEVFVSYNNKYEDAQIISSYEMHHYPLSNLIKLSTSNDIYLIEGNVKRRIPSPQVFAKHNLNWNRIIQINEYEFNWYRDGGELR